MSENKSANADTPKYQVYIDERKTLVSASLEQSRLFDKAILTLSSGALGLSLTFIRQIIPEGCEPEKTYFLVFAWVFLTVSIVSTVISFQTSSKACSKQIKIMEIDYGIAEKPTNHKNTRLSFYHRLTCWLNIFSVLCFIIGIIFLSVFSIHNLQNVKGNKMAERQKIQEGFVPQPTPPPPPSPKPVTDDQRGFVPPSSPKEPPITQKPSK